MRHHRKRTNSEAPAKNCLVCVRTDVGARKLIATKDTVRWQTTNDDDKKDTHIHWAVNKREEKRKTERNAKIKCTISTNKMGERENQIVSKLKVATMCAFYQFRSTEMCITWTVFCQCNETQIEHGGRRVCTQAKKTRDEKNHFAIGRSATGEYCVSEWLRIACVHIHKGHR